MKDASRTYQTWIVVGTAAALGTELIAGDHRALDRIEPPHGHVEPATERYPVPQPEEVMAMTSGALAPSGPLALLTPSGVVVPSGVLRLN